MRFRTIPRAYERDVAFREFARQRAAPLHRSAYLLCGDWHLAEDLVQEALAKVYVHWRRVQDADNPDAYVRRILVNEARQRWRRKDAPVPRAAAVTDRAGPDWSEDVVRRAELFEALLRLPAGQRATIVLRHLDGLSEREMMLGLYERTNLEKDASLPPGPPSSTEFSLGIPAGSQAEVDRLLQQAEAASGTLTAAAHMRPFGVYSGYFTDPDGHLFEIVWDSNE